MKKLHGNCIGKLFGDSFHLIRPVEGDINFNLLCSLASHLIIIKTRTGRDTNTLIKGQLEYIDDHRSLLFTGTPWFNSIEEL
jgi:hypothetical protein